MYRIFPLDSRPPGLPQRPDPRQFALRCRIRSRDSRPAIDFHGLGLAASFTVLNSVQPGGIHPSPGQTTGGNGALTGQEVQINMTFLTPFNLVDSHLFFEQVVDAARALGVSEIEAIVSEETQALTRFANNAIHQNVSERSTQLSVRPVIEGRTARATTNRLDREGIRDVVAEAIAITRLNESDADLPPLTEPAEIQDLQRYFEATAQATPEERAQGVAEAIRVVSGEGQQPPVFIPLMLPALRYTIRAAWRRVTAKRWRGFRLRPWRPEARGGRKAARAFCAIWIGVGAGAKGGAAKRPGVTRTSRTAAGALHGDSGAGGSARPGGPDVHGFQRDGGSRRPELLNDRMGTKLFGENIKFMTTPGTAAVRSPVRWGRRAAAAVDAVEGGVVREIAYSRQAVAFEGSRRRPATVYRCRTNSARNRPTSSLPGADSAWRRWWHSTERGHSGDTAVVFCQDSIPFSANCTPLAASSSVQRNGSSLTTCRRNSSHWTLKALS